MKDGQEGGFLKTVSFLSNIAAFFQRRKVDFDFSGKDPQEKPVGGRQCP